MSVRATNFDHLLQVYYRDTKAYRAADILRRNSDQQAGEGQFPPDSFNLVFLKNWKHPDWNADISSNIRIREDFVYLMKFYSLLEMSSLADFIIEPSSNAFWSDVGENLNLSGIKEFYHSEYPMLLPEFLAKRLNGDLALREENQKAQFRG